MHDHITNNWQLKENKSAEGKTFWMEPKQDTLEKISCMHFTLMYLYIHNYNPPLNLC